MRYVLFALSFMAAGWGFQTSSLKTHPLGIAASEYDVVETVTDSTKPAAQMSTKEKIDAHVVHFTGAVMSDTFVVSHFSRAFVTDQYSDFLKPGKYNDGSACLPNSIASSLDGIAIPQKTRLVVYNGLSLKGTKLIDVTGPAIVNNNIWQSSDFYSVANKKTYRRELQEIFPQKVRRWSGDGNSGMSYWQSFSFEILVVN